MAVAVLLLGLAISSLPQARAQLPPASMPGSQGVEIPSLDAPTGVPVRLSGHWFPLPGAALAASAPAAAPAPSPALVLLHGCGGVFASARSAQGAAQLSSRYTELAARLQQMGVQTLVLDSFSARGERELCTQRQAQRQLSQLQRRRDALGALTWLARQPGVDPARLGLLGWSHGGSTVLAATNLRHPEVANADLRPSLAVAFYPGCSAELGRGYAGAAPLLMMLGGADDWTPPEPCQRLVAASSASAPVPALHLETYAGAYHGFDGRAPVRLRLDVPNGVNGAAAGVHVGGNDAARLASVQRLDEFLRSQWGLPRPNRPAAAAQQVNSP